MEKSGSVRMSYTPIWPRGSAWRVVFARPPAASCLPRVARASSRRLYNPHLLKSHTHANL